MDEYLERRVSNATVWSRRVAIFSAVLFLTAGIRASHRISEHARFYPGPGVVAAFAILALLFAVARAFPVLALWRQGRRYPAFRDPVSLLVLTPFGITAYRGLTLPMLNDVSTDTDDPPELAVAAAQRTARMNSIEPFTPERRKLQQDNYPMATGRRYEAPIRQVVEVVQDVLDNRGWRIVSPANFRPTRPKSPSKRRRVRPFWDFPADVAIRLIDEDTSTYVDMRSASRYGPHDFGDNAARIASFLAELDVEIAYLTVVTPVEPAAEPPKQPKPAPLRPAPRSRPSR